MEHFRLKICLYILTYKLKKEEQTYPTHIENEDLGVFLEFVEILFSDRLVLNFFQPLIVIK